MSLNHTMNAWHKHSVPSPLNSSAAEQDLDQLRKAGLLAARAVLTSAELVSLALSQAWQLMTGWEFCTIRCMKFALT